MKKMRLIFLLLLLSLPLTSWGGAVSMDNSQDMAMSDCESAQASSHSSHMPSNSSDCHEDGNCWLFGCGAHCGIVALPITQELAFFEPQIIKNKTIINFSGVSVSPSLRPPRLA